MFDLTVIATANFRKDYVEFEAGGVYECKWHMENNRYLVRGIGGVYDFSQAAFKEYFRTTDLTTFATELDNSEENDRFFMVDDCAQTWGDIAQELWERYQVIINGAIPIKVVRRRGEPALLVMGHEDDGKIWFDKQPDIIWPYCYVNSFSVAWAPDLIYTLSKAMAAAHAEE